MTIKKGVSVAGVQPQIILALLVAKQVWIDLNLASDGPTITSCTDGQHGRGSLHHVGLAVDIRRPVGPSIAEKTAGMLALRLGELEYDVVLEDDHIHIEYQPY